MFIPTTPEELVKLGWDHLDVILISGDTYIDTPYSGVALIGHQLIASGYKVGIIAQPEINSSEEITRLGEPALFWGISAGLVDSLVANKTPLGKPRKYDDHTPGGLNTRRPDRASIVYANLIRRYFKNTAPVVLGGIEASLRRLAHYDFWSDSLRRSILLDAKADYILYGMSDLSVLELAETLKSGGDPRSTRGLCYASDVKPADYLELPSFAEVTADKPAFTRMFHLFYHNNDPISAQGLAQRFADRYVIQNSPPPTLTTEQMDAVYALPFEHQVHPFYAAQGEVRALETIRFSIPTHRGCYGECNFCAIAVHEGRRVTWRSEASILAEARQLTQRPGFTGIIHDLSAPTANMYGFECHHKAASGACVDKSCLYPQVCPQLGVNHQPHTELLRKLRAIPEVRKVHVSSGIRHDMVMADANYGQRYLDELVSHHVSGQLKLAPEHSEPGVLRYMRKPNTKSLLAFKSEFDRISQRESLPQFLTYYMIAAHPGCTQADMLNLQRFAGETLGVLPEQVQIYTPTPSTYSSLMYYTEQDPWSGEPIFVEKELTGKMRQKAAITGWRKDKRGQSAGRVNMNEFQDKDKHRPQRFQREGRPKPQPETTEVSPEGLRYKKSGETRIIRDDYGHFFNNKLPEGWVDKRDRPARPPLKRRPASPHDRWNDGEKPYFPKEDKEFTPSDRSDQPARRHNPRKPAGSEASRPSYSSDKPYRPRRSENARDRRGFSGKTDDDQPRSSRPPFRRDSDRPTRGSEQPTYHPPAQGRKRASTSDTHKPGSYAPREGARRNSDSHGQHFSREKRHHRGFKPEAPSRKNRQKPDSHPEG